MLRGRPSSVPPASSPTRRTAARVGLRPSAPRLETCPSDNPLPLARVGFSPPSQDEVLTVRVNQSPSPCSRNHLACGRFALGGDAAALPAPAPCSKVTLSNRPACLVALGPRHPVLGTGPTAVPCAPYCTAALPQGDAANPPWLRRHPTRHATLPVAPTSPHPEATRGAGAALGPCSPSNLCLPAGVAGQDAHPCFSLGRAGEGYCIRSTQNQGRWNGRDLPAVVQPPALWRGNGDPETETEPAQASQLRAEAPGVWTWPSRQSSPLTVLDPALRASGRTGSMTPCRGK